MPAPIQIPIPGPGMPRKPGIESRLLIAVLVIAMLGLLLTQVL